MDTRDGAPVKRKNKEENVKQNLLGGASSRGVCVCVCVCGDVPVSLTRLSSSWIRGMAPLIPISTKK